MDHNYEDLQLIKKENKEKAKRRKQREDKEKKTKRRKEGKEKKKRQREEKGNKTKRTQKGKDKENEKEEKTKRIQRKHKEKDTVGPLMWHLWNAVQMFFISRIKAVKRLGAPGSAIKLKTLISVWARNKNYYLQH